MNLIRKSIPNSGGINSKIVTKLFHRFMNTRVELWNDKGITTNLTAPGSECNFLSTGVFGCTIIYTLD